MNGGINEQINNNTHCLDSYVDWLYVAFCFYRWRVENMVKSMAYDDSGFNTYGKWLVVTGSEVMR